VREAVAAGAHVIYKKIDSTLRGNISAELNALISALPGRTLVLAPAFPHAGRITRDGRCLVGGIPVHETEFGRDQLSPVRSALIADVLPTGAAVVSCDARELGAALRNRSRGAAIVVDAESNDDLDEIARNCLPHLDALILVGSAGLAGALARASARRASTGARAARGPGGAPHARWDHSITEAAPRPVLGLVGSLSERSRRQAAVLAERTNVMIEVADPRDIDRRLLRVTRALREARPVVVLSPPRLPGAYGVAPTEMARALARFATKAAAECDHGEVPLSGGRRMRLGLFLTGGDTALAAIRELGADELLAHRELAPGVPLLTARVASVPDAPVVAMVTKAGGFGDDEVMIRAFECLRGERCWQ
jgi:uncharacterized protein YgbK (DUF1537 family)